MGVWNLLLYQLLTCCKEGIPPNPPLCHLSENKNKFSSGLDLRRSSLVSSGTLVCLYFSDTEPCNILFIPLLWWPMSSGPSFAAFPANLQGFVYISYTWLYYFSTLIPLSPSGLQFCNAVLVLPLWCGQLPQPFVEGGGTPVQLTLTQCWLAA